MMLIPAYAGIKVEPYLWKGYQMTVGKHKQSRPLLMKFAHGVDLVNPHEIMC